MSAIRRRGFGVPGAKGWPVERLLQFRDRGMLKRCYERNAIATEPGELQEYRRRPVLHRSDRSIPNLRVCASEWMTFTVLAIDQPLNRLVANQFRLRFWDGGCFDFNGSNS